MKARRRRAFFEPATVRLLTTSERGHAHVAEFDDDGNGWTNEAGEPPHRHRVLELEVVRELEHCHQITEVRADAMG